MHTRWIAWLFAGAAALVAIDVGCAGTPATSSAQSSAAQTSATSGSGGHGGHAMSASSSSSSASSAATTGAGGSNPCIGAIDTPCKQCLATKCHDQAKACADDSMCMADGTPTSGCEALVACAAMKCTMGGMLDQTCVLLNCQNELASAGGPAGKGTQEAIALGQCLNQSCNKECTM